MGCAEETISKRKRDPEFMKAYNEQRMELITSARDMLQSSTGNAIATMAAVMMDTEASPQVRLNAADAILRHSTKYTEIGDVLERIKALEASNEE